MGNETMIQFFEWHLPADHKHWQRLQERAQELAELGITGVWIPPPTKGETKEDVGYGVYDLWDLGEFDQKNTVATKYGTKQELVEAIKHCKEHGLQIYCDVVLNHKAAADETERFQAIEVDQENRENEISEPHDIVAWTKFTFPGRGDKHSDFKWNFNHFTGTDWDEENQKKGVYRIVGENKSWADSVDDEFGNYDYLMFANIDYSHPEVQEETKKWAVWVSKELQLSGFRIDAAKHIDGEFIYDLMKHVRQELGNDKFYAVGEFWKSSIEAVDKHLEDVDYSIDLFDVPLHYNLSQASNKGKEYDLQQLFDETIVAKHPTHAVTFVDNHDSQPGESLESWVQDWFKPHAYAIILLRDQGYPCVFYGDLYGISGEEPVPPKYDVIKQLLLARKDYACGETRDYWDHPNTVGWVRMGKEDDQSKACAVVLTNSDAGEKRMEVGQDRAGQKWRDFLGHCEDEVVIEEDGWANFKANGGSVSVWVPSQ
ncbi:hypothetical protein K7432_004210 [Basidiobolus ranarum]|uniref:alpha-amylase n=1 Tax=Basidiobolus ranarum TaxID=34480 RepID=A0ABR2W4Y2_9FUNG